MTERTCPHCDKPLPDHTPDYLCPAGVDDLRDQVAALADLVDDVNLTITRQTTTGDRNGPRGNDTPVAWDDRASKALATVLAGLVSWAKSTLPTLNREVPFLEHRLTAPNIDDPAIATYAEATRRRLHRVQQYTRYLTGPRWVITGSHRVLVEILLDQLPHLARRPDVAAFRDHVARMHRDLLTAADTPAPRLYLGTCLADPLKTGARCPEEIYAIDHSDQGKDHLCDRCRTVRCRTCSTEHDVHQRRAWLREAMDDRLATAGDIARGLATTTGVEVTIDQIKGWVARGRLHARSEDQLGRSLYRVGDVIDLGREAAARDRERRTGKASSA